MVSYDVFNHNIFNPLLKPWTRCELEFLLHAILRSYCDGFDQRMAGRRRGEHLV
jgi:hypothetical protein